MSQATIVEPGKRSQDSAAKYGMYVGIAIFALGPISNILTNGAQILGDFAFWFGLYGWLAAGIAGGYVVYLIASLLMPQAGLAEGVATAPTADLKVGAQVSAGALPSWEVADMPAAPRFNFRNAIAVIGPGAI